MKYIAMPNIVLDSIVSDEKLKKEQYSYQFCLT